MEEGLYKDYKDLTVLEVAAKKIYKKFNNQNKHKMISIPTFKL